MKCLYDCGFEHGYSEPCASSDSPYYDSSLKVLKTDKALFVFGESSTEIEGEAFKKSMTQVERNAKWRAKDPERYREYQCEYMRKSRVKK